MEYGCSFWQSASECSTALFPGDIERRTDETKRTGDFVGPLEILLILFFHGLECFSECGIELLFKGLFSLSLRIELIANLTQFTPIQPNTAASRTFVNGDFPFLAHEMSTHHRCFAPGTISPLTAVNGDRRVYF